MAKTNDLWHQLEDEHRAYHVAPTHVREQIQSQGLKAQRPYAPGMTKGVYLHLTPEAAHQWANPYGDSPDYDVWEVDPPVKTLAKEVGNQAESYFYPVDIPSDRIRRMSKTADYQGKSNWDTWNTELMMDNEQELYNKAREIAANGTIEDLQLWAIQNIVGPHNKQAIEDAQEWNEIPEDERVDYHFEDLKSKSPDAADIVDSLGFGPDVSDTEPTLIQEDLINWQEIWDSLQNELEANAEYEREDERLRNEGLTFHMPGHSDETNKMLDAWLKHHGVEDQSQRLPDGGSAEFHTKMEVPIEHLPFDEGEHLPSDFSQWQAQGYGEPRVREYGWKTLHDIYRNRANEWQLQRMREALAGQGYSAEEIEQIMQPKFRLVNDTWIPIESPPEPTPDTSLDEPGDLTLPEHWGAATANQVMYHVAPVGKAEQIEREGLVTSLGVDEGYQDPSVYLFEHPEDARYWQALPTPGEGQVPKAIYEVDVTDLLLQADEYLATDENLQGRSWRVEQPIEPHRLRRISARNVQKWAKPWYNTQYGQEERGIQEAFPRRREGKGGIQEAFVRREVGENDGQAHLQEMPESRLSGVDTPSPRQTGDLRHLQHAVQAHSLGQLGRVSGFYKEVEPNIPPGTRPSPAKDVATEFMSTYPLPWRGPYMGTKQERMWYWVDPETGIQHMAGCGSGTHNENASRHDLEKLKQRLNACQSGACPHKRVHEGWEQARQEWEQQGSPEEIKQVFYIGQELQFPDGSKGHIIAMAPEPDGNHIYDIAFDTGEIEMVYQNDLIQRLNAKQASVERWAASRPEIQRDENGVTSYLYCPQGHIVTTAGLFNSGRLNERWYCVECRRDFLRGEMSEQPNLFTPDKSVRDQGTDDLVNLLMSKKANILDPISDTLDPTIWDDPESPAPTLKPQHRQWIIKEVTRILKDGGYSNPEEWLSLVFTGSLTTYQYSDRSDVDVSLFVDAKVFPEWSRAEMIGLMVTHLDDEHLPGTVHPLQCYVIPQNISMEELYQPGLRSGYLIEEGEWVVPPDKSLAKDIQHDMTETYAYALEVADKMDRLLTFEPHKAAMFYAQLHRRRRRDQSLRKGDFSEANIAYKMIVNRGYIPRIEAVTGKRIAQ